jgi:uncharacterized membrane protein HdeD (DUF308 family)
MSSKTTVNIERFSLMFRGGAAIVFGIAAVFWPGLTAEVLLYLFAAFVLMDGFLALVLGLTRLKQINSGALLLLTGLLELAVGAFLLRNPDITFATLILVLGLSLIAMGFFNFAHAFASSKQLITTRTMHALLGVLGFVIGAVVLMQPVAGGLAFVWILGLYALIAGPIMIAMSTDIVKPDPVAKS